MVSILFALVSLASSKFFTLECWLIAMHVVVACAATLLHCPSAKEKNAHAGAFQPDLRGR